MARLPRPTAVVVVRVGGSRSKTGVSSQDQDVRYAHSFVCSLRMINSARCTALLCFTRSNRPSTSLGCSHLPTISLTLTALAPELAHSLACSIDADECTHASRYYLTWDNCTHNCEPTRSTLLSTTLNPHDPAGWTLHGPVLPGKYTGGAALLFRDDAEANGRGSATHYAFVSDSNTAGSIMLATSSDGLQWVENGTFMTGRKECWDEAVAAGPQPERLSTGDYLIIYNIDTGFPCVHACAPLVFVTKSGLPLHRPLFGLLWHRLNHDFLLH